MAIYLGNTAIKKVYLGATEIKKIYKGSTLLYSSFTYDPDLLTYIAGLVTPLSEGQLILLNNLIVTIKTGLGISTLFDAFDQILNLANETPESSLRNMVRRANDATAVGAPTFTPLEGFTGDSTAAYINTNYKISSNKVNPSQNSTAHGYYSRTNNGFSYGSIASISPYNGLFHFPIVTATYSRVGVNSGRNASAANVLTNYESYQGMFICNRVLSTEIEIYRNKVLKATPAFVSTGMNNYDNLLLAIGTDAIPGAFNSNQGAFYFVTRGLSVPEIGIITDAFQAYMTANGKQV